MATRSLRSHRHTGFSSSLSNPRNSDESNQSHDSTGTAPTSVSASPRPSLKEAYRPEKRSLQRPVVVHRSLDEPRFVEVSYEHKSPPRSIPRSSVDTYASSAPRDMYDEPEEYDDDQDFIFELPEELENSCETRDSKTEVESRATTPQDFADYFPSQRRLFIHHDESSHDGNMNLKVETEEIDGDKKTNVQLFHLRMQDLESREFSLRRYCRESGREVCHSMRRYQLPASERPGLQRSVSNALASLRPDSRRTQSKDSVKSNPVRADSGYGSDDEEDYFGTGEVENFMNAEHKSHSRELPTRNIKLEFSNYAQVDVKRLGGKKSKHYDFEYWGHTYSWKRVVDKTDAAKTIKFHLVRHGSNKPIAHIIPVVQTPSQVQEEAMKGGWVPPCSLWISDPSVLTAFTDVADVIISTGLIALVDDCIKRHFSPKNKKPAMHNVQLALPLTPLKMEMEFVGPRAIVSHMFRRRSSGGSTQGGEHVHQSSPLRNSSKVDAV